jgi:gamma-glutamyl-gamma-aminobutyrate hydrolase PuuD
MALKSLAAVFGTVTTRRGDIVPRLLSEHSFYRWSGLFSICALLVLLLARAGAVAQTTADVTALFQEAQTTATQLSRDATTMESFTRSNLTWQSHSAQIKLIKEHINKAGSILSQMQAARADAKPWHQDAIDGITPTLKQLAANTESIVNALNQNPKWLKDPTYIEYLKSNQKLARDLSAAVGNVVDYDNTKTKMEELQGKLGQSKLEQ